ncbi:hypothetical protein, partial [Methylobacterium sp. WL8]|uniref:hypothetical protein n=1 Tax=Methylobacterium sp. WL8 TaxID=2603899 RepID=UPI001AEE2A17
GRVDNKEKVGRAEWEEMEGMEIGVEVAAKVDQRAQLDLDLPMLVAGRVVNREARDRSWLAHK